MIDSRKIEDLLPSAQEKIQEHIAACKARGVKVRIIQTLRDAEKQASLYAIGRTVQKDKKTVTKCDGYKLKSRHQSGKAWDMVPLDAKGNLDWSNIEAFEIMAQCAEALGITAGKRWKSVDCPHFEIP